MTIRVAEQTGALNINVEEGAKLYKRIADVVLGGQCVSLDFSNVRVFASPFFNAAIGPFLRTLTPEQVRERVNFISLTGTGKEIVDRVIANAHELYHNPGAVEALDALLHESEEKH